MIFILLLSSLLDITNQKVTEFSVISLFTYDLQGKFKLLNVYISLKEHDPSSTEKFSVVCTFFRNFFLLEAIYVAVLNKKFSEMEDLLLDPAIRIWVVVPIVLITFLVGVIRHHVSILLTSPKAVDLEQLKQRYVTMVFGVIRTGFELRVQSFVQAIHKILREKQIYFLYIVGLYPVEVFLQLPKLQGNPGVQ